MLYLLSYILLPLLLGCVFLVWGYRTLMQRTRMLSAKGQMYLEQQLESWKIDTSASPQILPAVNKNRRTLTGYMLLGSGISMLVSAAIMAGIALFTTGTLLAGNSTRGEPFAMILLLFWLVGNWLGWSAGFRKIKRESPHRIAFGDLRRRLVTDYRSSFLHVIPILLSTVNITVALIVVFNLHTPIQILLMNNSVLELPAWVILIMPVLMPLLIVSMEASMRNIVSFPRLSITTTPGLAQKIDDMLRAIMIGSLVGNEYSILGNLQMGQFLLLAQVTLAGGLHIKLPDYIQIWLFISYLSGIILIVAGITTGMLRGHLGGTISSWPNKVAKGVVNGPAAADS